MVYYHFSGVSTGTQALEQGLLGCVFLGLDQEGAQNGADDTGDGEGHGQQHAAKTVSAHSAQSEGSKDGAPKAIALLSQVHKHRGPSWLSAPTKGKHCSPVSTVSE